MLLRLLVLGLLCTPLLAMAQPRNGEYERIVDLRGSWLFNLGDEEEWAEPGFYDKDWDSIFVPNIWEEEGYLGYDGYAWYRKHFQVADKHKGKSFVLHLGLIDDVAAVYVNGQFVGTIGVFPPKFKTGYPDVRDYFIPKEYINFGGRNVIAVRVYDAYLEGGIREGRPGLYANKDHEALTVDLRGPWKFRTGDRASWRDVGMDDSGWDDLMVPAIWEGQGYKDYDGIAWYRRHFRAPDRLESQHFVLLLGMVDDLDVAYINGHYVGETGDWERKHVSGKDWVTVRAYAFPAHYLNPGGDNVVAVKVYDGRGDGGIYRGIVGIATPDQVEQMYTSLKKRSIWDTIESLFDDQEHEDPDRPRRRE